MTEEEWLACDDPRSMTEFIWLRATDRQLRFVVSGFSREKAYWLTDQELAFVEIAEQFADHEILADSLEMAAAAAHYSIGRMNPVANLAWAGLQPPGVDIEREWYALSQGPEHDSLRLSLLRDIFGNPFRPITFSPEWRTSTAAALASQMYESRDFSAMPILADALQDAGCDNADILAHCRDEKQVHVRGCWVVDLVLNNV